MENNQVVQKSKAKTGLIISLVSIALPLVVGLIFLIVTIIQVSGGSFDYSSTGHDYLTLPIIISILGIAGIVLGIVALILHAKSKNEERVKTRKAILIISIFSILINIGIFFFGLFFAFALIIFIEPIRALANSCSNTNEQETKLLLISVCTICLTLFTFRKIK